MKRARVLLADDHKVFLDGLASLLQPRFNVVATVDNGRDLLAAAREHHPELILADISMPFLNGIEALRKLKKIDKRVKVIILTMHHDASFVAEALRAGASGYVLKNSDASELLGAIEEVLKGRTYLSPLITSLAVGELLKETGADKMPSSLTGRQREVLQLISEGHTLKEISQIMNISLSTVEFHKIAAMRRLGLGSTAQLVRYAIAHGISPA